MNPPTGAPPGIDEPPAADELALTTFLRDYLGAWPPTAELCVIGSPARTRPGWDGTTRQVVGVASPAGLVLSVPPDATEAVRAAVGNRTELLHRLGPALGHPQARVVFGSFRWSVTPVDLPPAGRWVAVNDPSVPAWLHPFGSPVLVSLIDGEYAAGVGIKRHHLTGMELSVGTEPVHRGQGLATRLVAQAARWIIDQDAVAIYLHDPANLASARTAAAAGFPDRGWRIVGLTGPGIRLS